MSYFTPVPACEQLAPGSTHKFNSRDDTFSASLGKHIAKEAKLEQQNLKGRRQI